jgi:hypothetical protein
MQDWCVCGVAFLRLFLAFGLWRTCRTAVFLSATQQQRRHDFMSQKILVIHVCVLTLEMGMSPEQHWTCHALLRVLCQSRCNYRTGAFISFPQIWLFPQISLLLYHVTQDGRDYGSLWVQWVRDLATRRLVCVSSV